MTDSYQKNISLDSFIAELQALREKHDRDEIVNISHLGADVQGMSDPFRVLFSDHTVEVLPSREEDSVASLSEALCRNIDEKRITDTARVSVQWDESFGIAVDLNYSYDNFSGYGDSALCFAETYADGHPDKDAWHQAVRCAHFLKNKYNLPLDLHESKQLLNSIALQRPSLNRQLFDAASRSGSVSFTSSSHRKEMKEGQERV